MSHTKFLHRVFFSLALLALVRPLEAKAQQMTSSAATAFATVGPSASSASVDSQSFKPASPNPFQPSWSSHYTGTDERNAADSLLLQMDRKWTSTVTQYAFSAPASFYSPGGNVTGTADWTGSLVSGFTAYLNQSNTTAVRITSDLETYGQKRQAHTVGQPGGHDFTLDWTVSRLAPTKLGLLEVAAGGYQQRAISYPAFPHGPITDVLLGYSVHSCGFQTTVTLPDRNLVFLFRYGKEHLGATTDHSRVAIFQLSWTW